MATTIITKFGSGAPAASDVVRGELAVDTENKRLYTENSGGSVVELGTNPAANVTFGDNVKAVFGAGSDLQIYHDGSNSYIKDDGVGDLIIQAYDDIKFQQATDNADLVSINTGGNVGIGTTSPSSRLTVSGAFDATSAGSKPSITGAGNYGGGIGFIDTNVSGMYTDTSGANLKFFTNQSGSDAAQSNVRLTIDGSGNVGIGDTSPSTYGKLVVAGATPFAVIRSTNVTTAGFSMLVNSGSNGVGSIATDDGGHMTFDTGSTGAGQAERMRITSAGNVGIGTTSPNVSGYDANAQALTISGTNRGLLELRGATGANSTQLGAIRFLSGSTSEADIICELDSSGNGFLTFDTNGSEAMRIDSSGNVGIGETSPSETLELGDGSSTNRIKIDSSSKAHYIGYDGSNDGLQIAAQSFLKFQTGGSFSEAARIDSSGRLLVGKTATGIGTAGIELTHDNVILGTRNGGTAQYLNRLTSDGSIIEFQKDGTSVGSIGTANSDSITIGNSTGNLILYAATVAPASTSAGGASDGAVDLGASGRRFKDLYLGGLLKLSGGKSTYTDYETLLSATSINDAYPSFSVAVTGNGLGTIFGSNVSIDGSTFSQPNNLRSTGYFQIDNTTTASKTSLLRYQGFVKGSTTPVERFRMDFDGNFLVGGTSTSPGSGNTTTGFSLKADGQFFASSPSGDDHVFNINGTGNIISIRTSGTQVGTISVSGSATAYNTSSDYRLKENVVAMSGATERLKQLKPSRFNFIADPDETVDGFLAHEVQDVVPEAITGTKDAVDAEGNPEYQGIDQSKLVPLLVATIQELEARIAQLEGDN